MQEYDDIEQFSGGGRISPQASATYYPEGSLRSGNNGNLWINQKDINGRLSWKATPITKQKYPLIRYNEYEEQISIWLSDNLKIFYYYFDTPTLFFTYPDGKVLRISDRLNNLSSEFQKQFDLITYREEKNENDLSSDLIIQFIDDLTSDLISLQIYKKLRKPNGIPETPSEPEKIFEVGDFVISSKGFEKKIVGFEGDEARLMDADGYKGVFTFELLTELLHFSKQPKFKEGDKIFFPKKQNGYDLGSSAKQQIKKAIESGIVYFVIIETTYRRYGDPIYTYFAGLESEPNSAISFSEKECVLYTEPLPETPKPVTEFEVGDKVKLPSTKLSQKLRINMSVVWDKANEEGQDYLVVNEIAGKKIVLNTYLTSYEDPDGDYFNITLDKIELYEDRLEETEVKTDGTKITSKRTKEFYDNNKSKLDKIDSKISNKFIEALTFLSQYEESGEVIYTKQNKNTANDLISRIQNLKKTN